jgi:hypothetical protein
MNYSSYQLQYLGETYEETFDKISKFLPVGYSYTIKDAFSIPYGHTVSDHNSTTRNWEWVLKDHFGYVKYFKMSSNNFTSQLDALKDLSEYLHKTYGAKQ